MTTLTIHVHANGEMTAAEMEFGDNLRYVETFTSWGSLLTRLGEYMNSYAYIEIRRVG